MSTPTDGAQLSAASAFWGLVGLALNVIIQPTGRVCGFHPSVRAQVRSSPIVCVADSIFTVTRILFNIFYYKLSFKKACRLTLHRKKVDWKGEPHQEQGHSDSQSPMQTEESGDGTHPGEIDIEMCELQNEQRHSDSGPPAQVEVEGFGDSTANPVEVGPEATVEALGPGNVTGNMQREPSGDFLTFEGPSVARVLSFTLTGFPQWLKIIACSGAPWTSTWASFYFWPFLITEVINITAGRIDTEEDRLDWIRIGRINLKWEVRLDFYERALGAGISSVAHIPWRALNYYLVYHIFSVSNPFVLVMGGWRANASETSDTAISTRYLGRKAF
ncbi:hypothetical protein TWF173_010542 [Orbilia oligospora]|nr:hypothetical protein TWF173_010542 [Orbilia oligospora]